MAAVLHSAWEGWAKQPDLHGLKQAEARGIAEITMTWSRHRMEKHVDAGASENVWMLLQVNNLQWFANNNL